MPDVFTHLMVGASLALILKPRGSRAEKMMLILGAVLIDIERPVSLVLESVGVHWIGLVTAFHSLLGAVVLSYFAATCFQLEGSSVRSRFTLILMGCLSHLLLDMFMYPWAEHGLALLYPIMIHFSFHLVWPDFWLFPLFGAVVFGTALVINYAMKLHRQSGAQQAF